jgi:TPP-dependent pyruvate/acetoin dehydrogenase alpha subunit
VTKRIEQQADTQFLLNLYHRMLEIRLFELKAQELYRGAQLPGFIHLYIGQEAVATGVCTALAPEDMLFSTHRGHGHALAKGVPPNLILAELWGKTTGTNGGYGGSMHIFAPQFGFMGTNGIVGASLPLAAGAALSAQIRHSGQVVVSFFGDGATIGGSFHEALNLAAVWDLPVVYVCENNSYATEMAFCRSTKNISIASRAAAYKIPGIEVDGNDVVSVHDVAKEAIDTARRGDGPTLIECSTYRIVGHHEGDPGTGYRTKEEVESWKGRCPLRRMHAQLKEHGVGDETFAKIEADIARTLDVAVDFARKSPLPAPEAVFDHVF